MPPEHPSRSTNSGEFGDVMRHHASFKEYSGEITDGKVIGAGSVAEVATPGVTIDWDSVAKFPAATEHAVVVTTGQTAYAVDLEALTELPMGYANPNADSQGQKVRAADFKSGKIGRLDRPVAIGKPWEIVSRLTQNQDTTPVQSVMFALPSIGGMPLDKKTTSNGPSPVAAATERLHKAKQGLAELEAQRRGAGRTALDGA
jgi:hypothetical protein